MNDLYSIGYFDGDGDRYRINFDLSPLFNNSGSNGALFNLTDTKRWAGAGSAGSETFAARFDGTVAWYFCRVRLRHPRVMTTV